jgi:hypothetical protein
MMTFKADHKEALKDCFRQDDEIMPPAIFQQGGGMDFPMDGNFLQSHDVSSLFTN